MRPPDYHFRLFQDLGDVAERYSEDKSDALLQRARILMNQAKLSLTANSSHMAHGPRVLLATRLAHLLLRLPVATDEERLEDAIAICAPCMDEPIRPQVDEPGAARIEHARAVGHSLVGQAYLQRRKGVSRENKQLARRHFEQALELFQGSVSAQLLFSTHHNLGAACTGLSDFAFAIKHCQIAADGFPREVDATRWAVIQSDLGLAELSGDARRTESALTHILCSLEVFDRCATPRFWAHAQHRLAMAFLYRSFGDLERNLDAAIDHCRQALTVFTAEGHAIERRSVLLTLARSAYKSMDPCRQDRLSEAIDALTEARNLATARAPETANVVLLLARAHFARRLGVDDVLRAIECYETALDLLCPEKQASRAVAARELMLAQSLAGALERGGGT